MQCKRQGRVIGQDSDPEPDRYVHIPEGTVIGYDAAEDKVRYFVTPSGLTIVTQDSSLFENPVAPEFLEWY
ncbi:MAG: hypothetical protein ACRD3N_18665 [Terracidiphilus sp.]